jgi:hypothetical protein
MIVASSVDRADGLCPTLLSASAHDVRLEKERRLAMLGSTFAHQPHHPAPAILPNFMGTRTAGTCAHGRALTRSRNESFVHYATKGPHHVYATAKLKHVRLHSLGTHVIRPVVVLPIADVRNERSSSHQEVGEVWSRRCDAGFLRDLLPVHITEACDVQNVPSHVLSRSPNPLGGKCVTPRGIATTALTNNEEEIE